MKDGQVVMVAIWSDPGRREKSFSPKLIHKRDLNGASRRGRRLSGRRFSI